MFVTVFRTILGRAVCLLLASSALGLAVNAARPDGVRFTKFTPPNTCGAGETATVAGVAPLAGRHTLVVYGDGTEDAKLVAEELRRRADRAGRSDLRVLVIEGGFAAWSRAGLACSSGPCAECGTPGEPHK